MTRSDLLFLIQASAAAGRPDYARLVCNAWLKRAPGDLEIRFRLAQALAAEKQANEAVKQLEAITAVDFEHAAAHRFIAALTQSARPAAIAHIIDGQPLPNGIEPPEWMLPARNAVVLLAEGQHSKAREQIDIALARADAPPLASLLLLKTHWLGQEIDLALPLAKGFHERWPKSAAIALCLAECLLRHGDSHRAVELLHTISGLDSAAEVVTRYWGKSNPYRDLWAHPPAIALPGPVPAEVIVLLGWNRIERQGTAARDDEESAAKSESPVETTERAPDGSPRPVVSVRRYARGSAVAAKERLQAQAKNPTPNDHSPIKPLPEDDPAPAYPQPRVSEELRDVQASITALAAQLGSTRYQRKPAHTILFSPKLLKAKFGPEACDEIIGLIVELGRVTAKRRRVPVILLAPDEPADGLGLAAVDPAKAWDVKMMLHDLDRRLTQKGQAIGSLLIVGSDDLVPFHRLPNPTDDADNDIPSDNPYGTSDDNYFIPEWPVGRLPSPCGRDPEPLKRLLHNTIAAHQTSAPSASWLRSLLFRLLQRWLKESAPPSVGYAASIWKEASLEVFAPLGNEKGLHTSPPLEAGSSPAMNGAQLSYFNLHGVEDGPNWFGQRDFTDEYGPLYPVAFKPSSVAADSNGAPKAVFTEACYGANILNKSEPDAALCLRFLNDGACAFVGSTKIAYGSVAPPLIGADLLGRLFWENLLNGLPMGESLRRAKLSLAHTMHRRQNFLDGEDQKTLISFVLYGDPLLNAGRAVNGRRGKELPSVKTVAMEYAHADESEMQADTVAEIKTMLARYLPGAESAQVSLSRPMSPINAKAKGSPTHRVYTVAKTVRSAAHTLPAFARITVNKAGKVVKVAVSK